jgi:DNA (cytosine-5)-methyltransferase 1
MESNNNTVVNSDKIVDIHGVRQYLKEKSITTPRHGIPTGVILIPREYCGQLRKLWSSNVNRSLKRQNSTDSDIPHIGFKKVQEVPQDPNYFIAHLSPSTAQSFLDRNFPMGVEQFISDSQCEFYYGVRLFDPILHSHSCEHIEGDDNGTCADVDELSLNVGPTSDTSPVKRNDNNQRYNRFTFVELFAGIGGFRVGLEQLGGRCVFASEIDKSARSTYALNFGGVELKGDIAEYYAEQIPDFDILTGGFPCQPFSVRGPQPGLNDSKGQLYHELLRVLTAKQPKAFIFENVSSLVTIDGGQRNKRNESSESTVVGNTFEMMLSEFAGTGYAVTWRIVNSRHWLPQMRERVYIVGFRNDLKINSIETHLWDLLPASSRTGNSDSGAIWGPGSRRGVESVVRDILEDPVSISIKSCSLTKDQWNRIESPDFIRKANRRPTISALDRSVQLHPRCIDLDGKAPTLTSNYRNVSSFSSKFIFHERDGMQRDIPRFLSPRECARLMGFPDTFKMPLSKSNRIYHQIGNAVCPPVIHAIAQNMISLLEM